MPLLSSKKRNLENYRLISITLIPGSMRAQIIVETVSRQLKDKKVIRKVSMDL